MAKIEVFLPDEIIAYAPDLRRFFDAMIFKLRKNQHKGQWEEYSAYEVLGLIEAEVKELRTAMTEGNSMEIVLEAADIGNFALIAANIAIASRGNNDRSELEVGARHDADVQQGIPHAKLRAEMVDSSEAHAAE